VPSALDGLRRLCQDACDTGVTPGLVVAAGVEGRTPVLEAFGRRQTEPAPEPATVETVYDLASLTKALGTSLVAMRAVAEGGVALDGPLVDGGAVTLRQALAHAAGYPAHRPFFERVGAEGLARPGSRRAEIVALAAAEPPVYPAGTRSLYSDIGFILLGDRLERAAGARLDELVRRVVSASLGLGGFGFVDLAAPDGGAWLGARPMAASERCPVRRRLIRGEVHDLNAFVMGGVAGHAGLFGTAADVACIAHALCAAWRGAGAEGGAPIVDGAVLREFWRPAGVPASTWRLGWDGPAATGSLAGDRIARTAVGHLAFTGCSLWLDPERESFVVVLSNRVHPTVRDDPRFRALRPALNDAALAAVGYRS
jgi:CubicO group peptidase (beta-lactamase class C family)